MRKHRVLGEQLSQRAVRLQDARAALVLHPRTALVDPALQHRREQHREQDLGELGDESGPGNHLTNKSNSSRVRKLYIR